MELLNSLKWRYATKKFDASKKVATQDIQKLSEAVRLSASSYGLQPYKVMIIQNSEIREVLKDASWNQSQISDASHLFVFCIHEDYPMQEIDNYFQLVANKQKTDAKSLSAYRDFVKSEFRKKSADEKRLWAAKQAYIALGSLLIACAELRIDACPMEGFEKDKYDEILDLKAQGLRATVLATVGYRSLDDQAGNREKVRKPKESLFAVVS
jgi:nitroreductase